MEFRSLCVEIYGIEILCVEIYGIWTLCVEIYGMNQKCGVVCYTMIIGILKYFILKFIHIFTILFKNIKLWNYGMKKNKKKRLFLKLFLKFPILFFYFFIFKILFKIYVFFFL